MSYQFFFSLLVEANLFDSIFFAIQVVQGLHRNELCKIKIKTNHWCFTVFSTGKLILWYLYLLSHNFTWQCEQWQAKINNVHLFFILQSGSSVLILQFLLEWSYWIKWGRWWLELCQLGTATLARLVKWDTWKLINSCFVVIVVVFVLIACSDIHTKSNKCEQLQWRNIDSYLISFTRIWVGFLCYLNYFDAHTKCNIETNNQNNNN